jgi:hypothetical protein
MIRSIASAAFALIATSVQAMSPAPILRPDSVVTQVAFGCGVGMTLRGGVCVPRGRVYVAPATPSVAPSYYGGAVSGYYTEPHYSPYNHYIADTSGLPWDAVRAYYAGGPWYIGSNGWSDYAARYGIGCTPGTLIKGGDGIMYVCQ